MAKRVLFFFSRRNSRLYLHLSASQRKKLISVLEETCVCTNFILSLYSSPSTIRHQDSIRSDDEDEKWPKVMYISLHLVTNLNGGPVLHLLTLKTSTNRSRVLIETRNLFSGRTYVALRSSENAWHIFGSQLPFRFAESSETSFLGIFALPYAEL